jgi:hypothetical protein
VYATASDDSPVGRFGRSRGWVWGCVPCFGICRSARQAHAVTRPQFNPLLPHLSCPLPFTPPPPPIPQSLFLPRPPPLLCLPLCWGTLSFLALPISARVFLARSPLRRPRAVCFQTPNDHTALLIANRLLIRMLDNQIDLEHCLTKHTSFS